MKQIISNYEEVKNSETDFKEKKHHFMPSHLIVGQSQDGKSEGREKTH